MTLDIQHTIDVMTGALLRELGDEVELIFRFGSQLGGTTHRYSDVDIAYVPVHDTTRKSITVLVEDTLVDLFPLHWSQLERFADYDDARGTVFLNSQIVYQRDEAAARRFLALAERLRALQQPQARPQMLRKAQQIFQKSGYPYYLLRQQAAQGHFLASLQQAQHIFHIILHTIAACNQRIIDTRKLAQVLALPKLPEGLERMVERFNVARTTEELVAVCEMMLDATRALLLSEQQQVLRSDKSFAEVFGPGYPELKGDLQHVMLACERQDMLSARTRLMSLYHELLIHLSQARTGIEYSSFNTLAEYEQAFSKLGFPDLWSYLCNEDYTGLRQQCQAFDERLRAFLTEHSVTLYDFATTDELQRFLEA